MKNKRGSHIGVILSFAIFILFIIFFYTTIQPAFSTSGRNQILLNYLNIKLTDKISTPLDTITIKINDIDGNINKDCVNLENFLDELDIHPVHSVATNKTRQKYIVNMSGSNIEITEPGSDSDFDVRFLKIYNSSAFDETSVYDGNPEGDCITYSISGSNNYTIGNIKTESMIFERKIKETLSDYIEDYDALKDDMGISNTDEFGFSFTYLNGTTIETEKEIPSSINVYVEEIPVIYMSEDLNQEIGYLRIRVW